MSKKKLDLKNPIFILYLNIGNMSRQRSEAKIQHLVEYFDYENVKTFILPIENGDDRIEILWSGSEYMKTTPQLEEDYERLRNNLVKIIEIVSDGVQDEKVKAKLRKYMIDDILEKN